MGQSRDGVRTASCRLTIAARAMAAAQLPSKHCLAPMLSVSYVAIRVNAFGTGLRGDVLKLPMDGLPQTEAGTVGRSIVSRGGLFAYER